MLKLIVAGLIKICDEPLKMYNINTQNLIEYFVYSRETDGLQHQD